MIRHSRRKYFAAAFAALMVLSMIGPAAGTAVAAAEPTPEQQSISQPHATDLSSDTIDVPRVDNLSVWQGAVARPAVVDRSDGTTTVASQNTFIDSTMSGAISPDVSINTPQEAVFDEGENVTFDLSDDRGASTGDIDDGEDFRVLVAHVEPDADATRALLDAENVSVDEVRDAFEEVDGFEDFNDTIQNQNEVRFGDVRDFFEGTDEFETFAEEIAADQEISIDRAIETLSSDEFQDLVTFYPAGSDEINSGNAAVEVTLDQGPGGYVMIGHIGNEVLSSAGEQPTFNDTTVIGVDAIAAQKTASDITVDESVEAGDNVTVDATSNLDGENISHAVAVFDENTWSNTETTIIVDGEFDSDLRSEDFTIESDIESVQGVARIEPNTAIRGVTLGDERFSGTVDTESGADGFFSIRNAFVDGFDIRSQAGDAASFETVGDTTLNASITGIGDADNEAEIDVETLEEWDTGEYAVVHVATDQDTGEISTVRENVTLVEAVPDPNDVDIDNPAVNETEIEEGDTVQVSADVANNGPVPITVTATVTIDGTPSTDPALTRQVTIAPDATETVTFDVPRDTAGEFSLGIQFIHDGQEIGTVTAPESVTVSEPPRRVGGGVTTPPTDDPDVDAEPPEPPAEVDVELEETVDIEFDEEAGTSTATFSEENTVESITFGFQTSGTVNARNLDREPDETGPSPGASVRVTQITVGEELQDQPATIRMRVSLDRLEEIGADADDLRMNRYNADEGEWQGLETDPIGQTDTHVRLEAETPGFSYFSVSATSEPTAAIDAPAEVEEGEEVTLDASGSEDEYGEIVSYDWTVDGESLSGETVTTTLENPGDVDVELTVTNDAGETSTAGATVSVLEEDVGDVVDDPDDGISTILGVFVILLVIVLGVGGALYAQRQSE